MATKYSTATSRNCSLLSSSSPPEPEPEGPEPRPKPPSMNPTPTTKHHRTPPCTTTTTTTTVQNISSQFARLYANHKNQKLAEKDASCPTLTKSNSQKPADSRRKKEKKSDVLDAEKALAKKRFDDFKVKKVFDPYQYGSLALDRGRRKSFSCSQNELVNILSCSGVKVVAVDMPPFMQIHAVDCARKTHDSLEKFTSKALALTLKKEFDGVYGPAWHCIVGTSFGSFVTHSVGGFMYFSMDHKLYILLFKTTVQRAD